MTYNVFGGMLNLAQSNPAPTSALPRKAGGLPLLLGWLRPSTANHTSIITCRYLPITPVPDYTAW